jgi:hypothetical protein
VIQTNTFKKLSILGFKQGPNPAKGRSVINAALWECIELWPWNESRTIHAWRGAKALISGFLSASQAPFSAAVLSVK